MYFMFYLAQQSKSELGRLIVEVTRSHTHTHTHTHFDTQRTREMSVHALSGIRTGDPSNQGAADRTATKSVLFYLLTVCCTLLLAALRLHIMSNGMVTSCAEFGIPVSYFEDLGIKAYPTDYLFLRDIL